MPSPAAASAKAPPFGLKQKQPPAATPASRRCGPRPVRGSAAGGASRRIQRSVTYQAGYGMLKDANSPAKNGMKAT